MAGAHYSDIGAVIGTSRQRAQKAVAEALDDLLPETSALADEVRKLELQRLDRLLRALWPRALGTQTDAPNDKAVGRVLQLMERRAKLLGLDQAVKVEQTGAPMEIRVVRVDDFGRGEE